MNKSRLLAAFGASAFMYVASSAHAMSYRIIDMGTLGGSISSAIAINGRGQVAESSHGAGNAGIRAFLYDGTTMQDLCVLADCAGAGWDNSAVANAISHDGLITGWGDKSNGESPASLPPLSAAPVPEVPVPAAVWLFGSGLLGLFGIARRKKA